MSVFFTALNQESLLNLQGPDALSFLQGQATGDTAALSTRKALPALICTPQGRVVADLMCHLTGADQLQIRVRASVAEILCDHLKKYILFSKAELTPVGDWVMAGCYGDNAADTIAATVGEVPQEQYARCQTPDGYVMQLDTEGKMFECYAKADSAMLTDISAACTAGSDAQWQALTVDQGLARIEAEQSGEYVPQNLNFDLTGHISFTKGCYTGQEVVARLHYKGKAKKRVLPAVSSGTLPDDCDTLLDTDSGKPVATIINRSNDSDNNSHLLLYMKPEIDIAAASCEAEPALHFSALPLPYTISAD